MIKIPPLHIHSNYSFYNSTLKGEEIFEGAKKNNFPYISLTDSNFSKTTSFYKKCLEENFKPIIGLCFDCKGYAIALNYEGLKALYRISTKNFLREKDLFEIIREEKESPILFFVSSSNFLKELLKVFPRDKIWLEVNPFKKNLEILSYPFPYVYGMPVRCKIKNPKEEEKLSILYAIKNLNILGKVKGKIKDFQGLDYFLIEEKFLNSFEKIIENIKIEIPLKKPKLPLYPFLKNGEKRDFLLNILMKNFKEKYGRRGEGAKERLFYELKIVEEMGFIDYFLIVKDIVEEGKRRGFHFLGRGSAASSIICYLLEITPVDPIKENLYFERFLNPQRTTLPDIDLDFGSLKREEIIDYIYRVYGKEKVAMISTHSCYSLRGIFRDVAKTKGFTEEEILKITKYLPHYETIDLDGLKKNYPECKSIPYKNPAFQEIFKTLKDFLNFPKGWGIHCGGVVISPSPLTDFLALTPSSNGRIITQEDMYGVENLGLLKMDILGNRSLEVLPNVLSKIEKPLPNLEEICKDEKTKKIIREGKTIGCFYIESPAMRQLLLKLKVEDFPSLVIATSIIRPGVAESGMMQAYIRRHLKKEKPTYILPELEKILKETYGIMVYQEDVMKVANEIGGLSLEEADSFRKAMSGKSRSKEEMERALDLFIKKAYIKGQPREKIEELARQISSFAGYSFCKAHSASFSTLSFKMAYLKSHYPEIFLTSVLNCSGGFYPPVVYIQEAKNLGIKILSPFINLANFDYEGKDKKITIGFKAIKSLKEKTIKKILNLREEKKFTCFFDFYLRVKPDKEEAENLIKAGAFDLFGYERKKLLWFLNFPPIEKALPNFEKEFEEEILKEIPFVKDEKREKVLWEIKTLGYSYSFHPTEILRNSFKETIFSKDLNNYENREVKVLGTILITKRVWIKKQKKWMKFLSLSDERGFFEGVLFPKYYEKYSLFTKKVGPHLLEGKVKKEEDFFYLNISKITPLDF